MPRSFLRLVATCARTLLALQLNSGLDLVVVDNKAQACPRFLFYLVLCALAAANGRRGLWRYRKATPSAG